MCWIDVLVLLYHTNEGKTSVGLMGFVGEKINDDGNIESSGSEVL